MTVRNTSKAAYFDLMEKAGTSETRKRCLEFIYKNPGCTRNSIERGTGMRQASVSGRVNELIKCGAVYEDGCKRDAFTGQSNNRLYCGEKAA